ncbi:cysteine-rich receptor-like protein kinase 28 [Quercus suber]|uniref:Cysteine-rich receptor-like protein kinase 28 n=1 Tax=Quercus suber TaxID=58331 RepID=A0AAW0JZ63_QUESU
MAVVSSILIFLLSAILILIQGSAQPAFLYNFCLSDDGNFTSNSTYEKNLNQVLYSLYSNTTIDYGFYYSSYGQDSETACRGDVKPDDSRWCLKNSSSLLTQLCPYVCYVTQNSSIFGIVETSPSISLLNPKNVSANYVPQFDDDISYLLSNLSNEAAAGGSLRNGSNTPRNVIIIVVASVAFVVLIVPICISVCLRVRRPKEKPESK